MGFKANVTSRHSVLEGCKSITVGQTGCDECIDDMAIRHCKSLRKIDTGKLSSDRRVHLLRENRLSLRHAPHAYRPEAIEVLLLACPKLEQFELPNNYGLGRYDANAAVIQFAVSCLSVERAPKLRSLRLAGVYTCSGSHRLSEEQVFRIFTTGE